MRQVRTHAFGQPDADLRLHAHEVRALFGLPLWMFALFAHLVLRSNFKTGACRTSYGELINAGTPDQPERGPRLWAPSRDDVKAAIRRFEQLRLLALDRLRSEQSQTINFLVSPRMRRGVTNGKHPRELSPGSHLGEKPKLTPGTLPALPRENLNPLPLSTDELSTGQGRAKARAVLQAPTVAGRPHPDGKSAAIPRPRTIVASSFFMMTSGWRSLQRSCRCGAAPRERESPYFVGPLWRSMDAMPRTTNGRLPGIPESTGRDPSWFK